MNWVKFNQELRNTIETGKIICGSSQSKKECLVGNPKLLIISSTIDGHNKELFSYYTRLLDVPLVEYPESSVELGSLCGKPFAISVITVTDEGKSSLFDVLKEKESSKAKGQQKAVAKKAKKDEKKEIKKKKADTQEMEGKPFTKASRKTKEPKEEEKEEVPITEDTMFKDIIKIKKK